MSASSASSDSRPFSALWRSPWLHPLNDRTAINDLLGLINPMWALGEVRARVLALRQETADTKTVVLRPNRAWRGSRPGQHVPVQVEIGGVRHLRRYSISQESDGRLHLTVKRQGGGKVSNWLHDHLRPGQVLTLGQAEGDFVLPDPLPQKVLLLSAGSGITPVMRMLRALLADPRPRDLVFLHSCRDPADAIFGEELQALARDPRLRLLPHYSGRNGRLDAAGITARVPDYAQRSTWLCGPQSFMADIQRAWQAQGLDHRLHWENFAPPLPPPGSAVQAEVRCARSGRRFPTAGAQPLLLEAEQAGLQPNYGCRRGICHSCSCLKRSGVVENLLTGQVSAEPDQRVQLCITRARSDLVLDL